MKEGENQQVGECIQTEINPTERILDKSEQKGARRPKAEAGAKTEVDDENKKYVRLEGICQVNGEDVYLKNDPDDDEYENIEILDKHNLRGKTRSN
jgi:hypothetical protein